MIGTILWWNDCAARVVETEAYDVEGDEASHTFFKPSSRRFVEAHPPGTAYVYLNYGVHWMLNVLVKGKRQGFVLFRAIEPLGGIAEMQKRRGGRALAQLGSGPGKLTRALGINGNDHTLDLCTDPERGFHQAPERLEVVADPRIGITRSMDFPWRFSAVDHPHVSVRVKNKGQAGLLPPGLK